MRHIMKWLLSIILIIVVLTLIVSFIVANELQMKNIVTDIKTLKMKYADNDNMIKNGVSNTIITKNLKFL